VLSVSLRLGGKELFTAKAQRYAERRRSQIKDTTELFCDFCAFSVRSNCLTLS
jgi:hypothetical protein